MDRCSTSTCPARERLLPRQPRSPHSQSRWRHRPRSRRPAASHTSRTRPADTATAIARSDGRAAYHGSAANSRDIAPRTDGNAAAACDRAYLEDIRRDGKPFVHRRRIERRRPCGHGWREQRQRRERDRDRDFSARQRRGLENPVCHCYSLRVDRSWTHFLLRRPSLMPLSIGIQSRRQAMPGQFQI